MSDDLSLLKGLGSKQSDIGAGVDLAGSLPVLPLKIVDWLSREFIGSDMNLTQGFYRKPR